MFSRIGQPASSVFQTSPADQTGKQGLLDPANVSQTQTRPPIFGNLNTTSNSQLASIYSNTSPIVSRNASLTTTQPFPTSSPFGHQVQLQNQPGQPQQQQQPQERQEHQAGTARSVSSMQASQPAYFSSLLERGKKRSYSSTGNGGSGELPSLQLGLDDIRRTALGMGNASVGTPQQRAEDNKA
jgi:nuclear pore complex protein Nup93